MQGIDIATLATVPFWAFWWDIMARCAKQGRVWCFRECVLAFLLLASPLAQAQFTWTTNADNTITIQRYTGPGGDVSIPSAITGLPVTGIGDGAFDNCTSLTNITIPDNVTNIGDGAFANCSSLISVTIRKSVTSIGAAAFVFCSGLIGVAIPDSVSRIGGSAFGWSGLTSVTIGNGVTNIPPNAFEACPLTNCTIGNGVTSIGDYAFAYCVELN
ncbi:MAG TPA: leucine-rich repeat domain-containing protein, partial [Candidatus Acidoferrum sp.]|nr:leucine-rich repeat domain-containing protein [Candidatus Acidoferrum sp.]